MTHVLTAKRSNTDNHKNKLRNNNLRIATRSWEQESLNSELWLLSYGFPKFKVLDKRN
jgi:hypothetical protein